jgi:uncharacterized membrane protein YidH (DUF202 family)
MGLNAQATRDVDMLIASGIVMALITFLVGFGVCLHGRGLRSDVERVAGRTRLARQSKRPGLATRRSRTDPSPHRIGRNELDAAMTQPPPGPEHTDTGHQAPPVPTTPSDLDQLRRTSMAAERTWLAWWRTALGATAGALGVGRLAPQLLHVAAWPYILLGCGYASLAVGLLIVGARRERELEDALRTGGHAPLRFRTVGVFTVGGVALAAVTVVLVIAQT